MELDIRHITDQLWIYGPGEWDGKGLLRSSDEYGRKTLVLSLPGERAIVWAYRTCHCTDCVEVRMQTETAEAETQRVMAHYGVDRDAAYELSAEEWNRALEG